MISPLGRLLATLALLSPLALASVPTASASTPLDGFDPGMIISDANFYNASTQTAASIQTFLNAKGANCVPNPTNGTPCLKNYRADTPAVVANPYCAALAASTGNTAAGIISAVSAACKINPEVLVTLIQKEQALVTASGTSLTPTRYAHATGAGCPDYTTCSASLESFFLQVYGSAQQFQKYRVSPTSYRHRVGQASVAYNPEPSCGSTVLTIQNQATAGLYNYTPFVPNAAAIANPYGEGDLCSAYGIRNFYVLLRSWFPTAVTSSTAAPVVTTPPSTVTPGLTEVVAEYTRVGGYATLGAERSQTTCSSYAVGRCSKTYQYGTVTWSESEGGRTELGSSLSAERLRWAGADRYATASAIAANAFPESGVTAVFVATGELFPDAMAGGAAAAQFDGPLLLVSADDVPSATAAQLTRLKPRTIYVLGGIGAVSDAVAQRLTPYASAGVTRLAGADRYRTAISISQAAWPTGAGYVTISRGDLFPDALAAASLFGDRRGPILLSTSTGLDAATLAELRRLSPGRAYLAGGAASVPAAVEQQLAAVGIPFTRLSGPDRYATSLAVAKAAYPTTATDVFLALGSDFPDGLAVGPAASRRRGPVLLTDGNCISLDTARYLRTLNPGRLILVGGTGVLSDSVGRLRVC